MVAETVLEDVATLLGDCSRQFRRQQAAEEAKMACISSLVERDEIETNAERFRAFADACEKYAGMVAPPERQLTEGDTAS